jgi:uncharacterized membrane-anchored protein
MKKFKKAQVQNQESIKKHLEANIIESSSSEDEVEEILETAVEKVLSNYQYEGGNANRTFSYLTETFQSGGSVCLICISSVKKVDPVCIKVFLILNLLFLKYQYIYFNRFGVALNVILFYICLVFNIG